MPGATHRPEPVLLAALCQALCTRLNELFSVKRLAWWGQGNR